MKRRATYRSQAPQIAVNRAHCIALRGLLLSTALCIPQVAGASDRYDHRGAIGFLLGPGIAFQDRVVSGHLTEQTSWLSLLVGGTFAIGNEGNELKVLAQAYRLTESGALAVSAGYRGYFGQERVKTFFDLDARADVAPNFAIGPRLGLGVQYEVLPTFGIFAAAAAHAGAGHGVVFGAEAFVGIQLRSYLLE